MILHPIKADGYMYIDCLWVSGSFKGHGYSTDLLNAYIWFSCKRSGDIYSVTFSDNGIPFDPVNVSVRNKEFEELDTGGMGIMLARSNSKEMIYSRIDGRNVLTLSFEVYDIIPLSDQQEVE